MRVALDSNVLIYAEGVNGRTCKAAALKALRALQGGQVLVPVQALGEFFAVVTRKYGWDPAAARRAVNAWSGRAEPIETTTAVVQEAMGVVAAHRLAFWDAVMLAAAAQADCRELLSEDMQHGFAWRGVTVRNPFGPDG